MVCNPPTIIKRQLLAVANISDTPERAASVNYSCLYQSAQRTTKASSVFITAAAHSECSHMLLDGRKEGRTKSSLLPLLSEEPIFRKSSIKAAVFSYCQLLLNELRLCKLRMLGRLEAAQHPCSSLKFWKDLFTWTALKCAIGRQRGALVQCGKAF